MARLARHDRPGRQGRYRRAGRRRDRHRQGAGRACCSTARARAGASRSSRSIAARLPEAVAESELFGHEAGLSRALRADRPDRGVQRRHAVPRRDRLAWPLAVQAKMLRVLEEREVHAARRRRRRGRSSSGSSPRPSAISAQPIAGGSFREDLFYRLNVVRLRIPPLRERRSDIPLLFANFVERGGRADGRRPRSG